MALIRCPECDGMVSDKADVCVHCGWPVSEQYVIRERRVRRDQEKARRDEDESRRKMQDDILNGICPSCTRRSLGPIEITNVGYGGASERWRKCSFCNRSFEITYLPGDFYSSVQFYAYLVEKVAKTIDFSGKV